MIIPPHALHAIFKWLKTAAKGGLVIGGGELVKDVTDDAYLALKQYLREQHVTNDDDAYLALEQYTREQHVTNDDDAY